MIAVPRMLMCVEECKVIWRAAQKCLKLAAQKNAEAALPDLGFDAPREPISILGSLEFRRATSQGSAF
jgi:hypothetical protein